MGAKSKNLKEGVEMAKRHCVTHPLSGSQRNRGHFTVKLWESGKHKSWGMPAEGFKGHVANGRLSSGDSWKVGSMWLVSGATGLC